MTKNLIPTINISSIINQDFNSNKSIKTINKINKACINIGFFQVIGHGINKKNFKIFFGSILAYIQTQNKYKIFKFTFAKNKYERWFKKTIK